MLEYHRRQPDVVPGYPRVYTVLSEALKLTYPWNTVLYVSCNRGARPKHPECSDIIKQIACCCMVSIFF